MLPFDKTIERRGSGAVKYDIMPADDIIPMWVADMDFEVAPCITEALSRRVSHGVFGYSYVLPSYYESVIYWFRRRYGWHIRREWIQYTTGVVPAMSAVIKALTQPGDGVILFSPVYNLFFTSIRNNKCQTVDIPLLRVDKSPNEFTYVIDFEAFEQACRRPEVKMLLFCSHHNPAGRVWTYEELKHVYDICRRNDIILLSDEIHCELVQPGCRFIPMATVAPDAAEHVVTCNSPSKSFNIAGLQIANIITSNEGWRQRIDRALNDNEVCDVNVFAPLAVEAAYSKEGEQWLTELNAYLAANYQALKAFFAENLPEIPVATLEGTYLVWIDVTSLLKRHAPNDDGSQFSATDLEHELMRDCRVYVNGSDMYGAKGFLRINIAMPRSRMMEGLRRLMKGLKCQK
ncbi:MAG: pyridoxal phosphate-dependent aminotransferase [Bacteroidaceae bacterium]|nr:pyridoxal phosphate-dependent aminotransferase [Bacteroidaceae bacterium]